MTNKILNHFNETLSDKNLKSKFLSGRPIPNIIIDNFLPISTAKSLELEMDIIPKKLWKKFTRNQSYMEEYNDLLNLTEASRLVSQIHSKDFIKLLENITNINGLTIDPNFVGAGYSQSYQNDCLKIHTDFNWNESIKAYRTLNLIIYLTSDWEESYGGHLEFYDKNNKHAVQKIAPLFNRAIIWKYDERGFHGYPIPLTCPPDISRKSIRFFFYTPYVNYIGSHEPHRSLYWYDTELKEPYDIRSEE
jgi:hypothetical protein